VWDGLGGLHAATATVVALCGPCEFPTSSDGCGVRVVGCCKFGCCLVLCEWSYTVTVIAAEGTCTVIPYR